MTSDVSAEVKPSNTSDSRPAQEPRTYVGWRDHEDAKLLPLIAKPVPSEIAATILPGRSANAVQRRMSKLRAERGIELSTSGAQSDDEFRRRRKRAEQSDALFMAALRKAGFHAR